MLIKLEIFSLLDLFACGNSGRLSPRTTMAGVRFEFFSGAAAEYKGELVEREQLARTSTQV